MRRAIVPALLLPLWLLAWGGDASAFCGFYVGKADTKLFNKASEVAIAVGYGSENRFRIAFKKATGLSPKLWRETMQTNLPPPPPQN